MRNLRGLTAAVAPGYATMYRYHLRIILFPLRGASVGFIVNTRYDNISFFFFSSIIDELFNRLSKSEIRKLVQINNFNSID